MGIEFPLQIFTSVFTAFAFFFKLVVAFIVFIFIERSLNEVVSRLERII